MNKLKKAGIIALAVIISLSIAMTIRKPPHSRQVRKIKAEKITEEWFIYVWKGSYN